MPRRGWMRGVTANLRAGLVAFVPLNEWFTTSPAVLRGNQRPAWVAYWLQQCALQALVKPVLPPAHQASAKLRPQSHRPTQTIKRRACNIRRLAVLTISISQPLGDVRLRLPKLSLHKQPRGFGIVGGGVFQGDAQRWLFRRHTAQEPRVRHLPLPGGDGL